MLKNILIGAFLLLAFAIIIFMLIFLHPSVGDNAKTLRVRFADIDKVNVGTRVTYAGRPVGEVVTIEEIPESRTSRVNSNGDVYVYELTLKVDSSVDVFNTDEISLRTSGLLGERNIEINPRPLSPDEKLQPVEDRVLFAVPTANVEETLKRLGNLSDMFQIVLKDVHVLFDEVKNERIVENVSKTIKNVVDISEALNEPKIWRETTQNIHTLSENAVASWKLVDPAIEKMHALVDKANGEWSPLIADSLLDIKKTLQIVSQIAEKTANGEGTIGQLLVRDDLYLRMKSLVHKGATVADDIRHYGILFQLDKRWQRLQANRLKLLERLSTQEEFTNYFYHEMGSISSSIERVSTLINEMGGCPQSLLYNPEFTSRFSELLKQVGQMEDTLEFYNEQLIEVGEAS